MKMKSCNMLRMLIIALYCVNLSAGSELPGSFPKQKKADPKQHQSSVKHEAESGGHLDQSSVKHEAESGGHLDNSTPGRRGADPGADLDKSHPGVAAEPRLDLLTRRHIKAVKQDYDQRLTNCERTVATFSEQLAHYQSVTETLTGRVTDQNTEIDLLKTRLLESYQTIDNIARRLDGLTTVTGGPDPPPTEDPGYHGDVAFMAQIGGFTGSPNEKTTIPFNIVDLNIGDGYNGTTGVFTPPLSGLYAIGYEILADGVCGTDHVSVHLDVNGVTVAASCSENVSSGGTSVSIQLAAGDAVTLAISSGGPCQTLYVVANFNTFSGHLVNEIF